MTSAPPSAGQVALLPARAPRGPGRPKDQRKRAAIVAAATGLFMERGYAEVTMEAVAAAARVSKMTVYGHFRDKAALFGAVVRGVSDQMTAALTGLPPAGAETDLETRLTAVGTALLGMILSPRVVAMSHALMGMLMKDRALAAAFYEAGPGNVRAVLARYLADAAAQGLLRLDAPQAAADDLLGLWEGDWPKRIALALVPAPSAGEIEARARRAVRVFLRAYRAA
ncbi:MAG: TetR/AcrR family transcriptional regulator [Proteobacteria bacterium]|nr:TetR/AcrR family transcriptional regulator [Pseudomonadota bacterium]